MGVVRVEGDNGYSLDITTNGEAKVALSSSGNFLSINPDGSIDSRIKDDLGSGVVFNNGNIPVIVSSSLGNEILSKDKNTVFSIHNSFGLSDKRNVYSSTGSPIYSVSGSEISISTTGASDQLIIETNQIGTPVHGLLYEANISVRVGTLTSSQKTEWGYFDNSEGYYFGKDSTGVYCAIRRNGIEESKTYQSGWSVDKLDGTGTSALTLNTASGANYYIQTTCSEYGTISFYIELNNGNNGSERSILVHRINPVSSPVLTNHNKPISMLVFGAGNVSYLGGRSFSVYGDYKPLKREVNHTRLAVAGLSTTLTPVFVVRRKSAFEKVPIEFSFVNIQPDIEVIVEVYKNPTLTATGAFTVPLNYTSSETACEVTNLITGISDGQKQFGFLSGNSGFEKDIKINFDRNSYYVVAVKRTSGNGGQATIQLSWEEYW